MFYWKGKVVIRLFRLVKTVLQLTERMTAVLIVAHVFALRTVVCFVSLSLLFSELESTAATIFLLKEIEMKSLSAQKSLMFTSHVEYVLIFTIFEFRGNWNIFCFLSRIFCILLCLLPAAFVDDSLDISHVFDFRGFSSDFNLLFGLIQ